MSPSASDAAASPAANAARSKPPTPTPIMESAHLVFNGSIHLLQDTLADAGAASRFYPTSSSLVGGKLQGAASTSKKQKATNSKYQSQRLDGHQHVAPATSSFTAPDRNEVGPTRSTRVASVYNKQAAASSSYAQRSRSVAGAKQGNAKTTLKANVHKKNKNQVGKVKVSIGDAAHHFWNRLMGKNDNAKSRQNPKRTLMSQSRMNHDLIKQSIESELPSLSLKRRIEPKNENSAGQRQQFKQAPVNPQEDNLQDTAPTLQNYPQIQVEQPGTNANPPNTTVSILSSANSPSIPLYPLLFLLFLHHLLTRVFSYRNRTKMHRKVEGMLGSKKFSVSQEELTKHIDLLAKRNKEKGNRGEEDHDEGKNFGRWNGDKGGARHGKNGDAAGGYDHGSGKRKDFENRDSFKEINSSNKSCDHSAEGGTLNCTLLAISESLKQFKDEKEELIHQRRLLLQDRDCIHDEKEVLLSEKKLFLKILAEKERECERLLKANQELQENVEMLESECATANDTAQNLAEKLTQTKNEKHALSSALEARKLSHSEVMASMTEWKERLSESEAKVAQLTNENIILKNVIARLEEENNEMEKVIDEACRSGNGDVDIEEIDCAIISSCDGVSEAESLTRDDDDSVDSQELKRRVEENNKLCLEKETLQIEVEELQQLLSRTRSELETISSEKNEHANPSQETDKLDELKESENKEMLSSLCRIQDERDQLRDQLDTREQLLEEITSNLSQVQDECDQLRGQLLQRTEDLSTIESKLDDLRNSEKELTNALSQVQNERNTLQTQLSQQSKELSLIESHMDKLQKSQKEIASSLSQVEKERDKLRQQLDTIENTKNDRCMEQSNQALRGSIESMKTKNDQLQNSLADVESLYETLRVENNHLQKSFEVTSGRFKILLSEKDSLQKSLRKERKRIAKCNALLKDSLNFASSLINELQHEIQRAHGVPAAVQEEQISGMMSEKSEGASEGSVLLSNAEALIRELRDIKLAKQHLVLAVQKLIWDVIAKPELAEEFSNCGQRFEGADDDLLSVQDEKVSLSDDESAKYDEVSLTMSNKQIGGRLPPTRCQNQSNETTIGETASCGKGIRQSNANHFVKNGNAESSLKMIVSTTEGEMNCVPKPCSRKSNSPTNVPLIRRLWRKKSSS